MPQDHSSPTYPLPDRPKRLLCLSNGHGEDAIAVRILQALQRMAPSVEQVALPLVGIGNAYTHHNIPLMGPAKTMPSGGFIYMDGRQVLRDLKGGLVQLTLEQIRTVRAWAKSGGAVLAVGDLLPLLFGWISAAPYGFVGTAKSEYYLRDEQGLLPRQSWFEQMESWSGAVYLPWERWLMQHPRCKAVFPRDTLTAKQLKQWPIPVFDLGNPMMDDLDPEGRLSSPDLDGASPDLTLALIPGSRPPEVYENWELMLQSVQSLLQTQAGQRLWLIGAIAPTLDLTPIRTAAQRWGWQAQPGDDLTFTQSKALLTLAQGAFQDAIHLANGAIAMAGTATEQVVGLGKPAFILPGQGPQFTAAFAEAQTRLLGPSVIQVPHPAAMGITVAQVMADPEQMQRIQHNGQQRMGAPGASDRMAQVLLEQFGWSCAV